MVSRTLLIAAVLHVTSLSSLRADLVTHEVFLNGSSAQIGGAGDASVTFRTNTLTSTSGVTFRLLFVGTAASGTIQFPSSDLGIQQTAGMDQFDEPGDAITFDSLSVVDFDAGSTALTIADISGIGFTDVSLNAAGSGNDEGTVNGIAFDRPGDMPIVISGGPVSSVTLTRTNGTFRLDSLGISATVGAVPEPNSAAGLALALFGLTFRRRSSS